MFELRRLACPPASVEKRIFYFVIDESPLPADADLNEDIVTGVNRRAPEIDFKTATEAGLLGLSDLEVLSIAAAENRIIITHDRKTMPKHFADFVGEHTCPGVFVVSQHAAIGKVIDDLILIWHLSEAEEDTNSIRTLPL